MKAWQTGYYMIMKIKKVSERSIVMKAKNGVKENIAVETEKMNKTARPLSPDLSPVVSLFHVMEG